MKIGFALDIDGVLGKMGCEHKRIAIPGVKDTLKLLDAKEINYVIVSNNSSTPEGVFCRYYYYIIILFRVLSEQLFRDDYQLNPNRMILSSTPSRRIALNSPDKMILVLARTYEDQKLCASAYNLNRYILYDDYITQRPYLYANHQYQSQRDIQKYSNPDEDPIKIDIILFYSVPVDWLACLQVSVDILRSNGTPGIKNELKSDEEQKVKFIATNGDVEYNADYPIPRLAAGSYVESLKLLYNISTKKELKYEILGKPYKDIFEEAEMKLTELNNDVKLDKIYMIGDSLISDIKGSNNMNDIGHSEWEAILVKTGMYKEGESVDGYNINYIGNDLSECVNHILNLHGL